MTAPTIALPTAAIPDEPHDEQQHDCTHGGVKDRPDDSDTNMNPEPRQQPVADEGPNNPDDEITDEAKTRPPYEHVGRKPPYYLVGWRDCRLVGGTNRNALRGFPSRIILIAK
jgi:hypothetical protein